MDLQLLSSVVGSSLKNLVSAKNLPRRKTWWYQKKIGTWFLHIQKQIWCIKEVRIEKYNFDNKKTNTAAIVITIGNYILVENETDRWNILLLFKPTIFVGKECLHLMKIFYIVTWLISQWITMFGGTNKIEKWLQRSVEGSIACSTY